MMAGSSDVPIYATVEEDERAVIQVRTRKYIKLQFSDCTISLREEDGVVYTCTEHGTGYASVDPLYAETDPIAEACKGVFMFTPTKGVVVETSEGVAERHADVLNGFRRLSLAPLFEEEEEGSDSSEDSQLNYSTDSSPALSYHYGDSPGYTQTMDEVDSEAGLTQVMV